MRTKVLESPDLGGERGLATSRFCKAVWRVACVGGEKGHLSGIVPLELRYI